MARRNHLDGNKPPRNIIRDANDRLHNVPKTRATQSVIDLRSQERSSVLIGGEIVYLKRKRKDGTTYQLRVRVGAARSSEPAIASKTIDGKIIRVGRNESFDEALNGRDVEVPPA